MYADLNLLRARAGRLAGAWTLDTDPDEADLERFLAEASAQLDLELGGQAIETPVTDSNGAKVLSGIAADGALVMALEATWPGGGGRPDVTALRDGAQARWDAALAAIRDGTSALVTFLTTAGGVTAEPAASCFWIQEPFYPYTGLDEDLMFPLTAPGAYRGQSY